MSDNLFRDQFVTFQLVKPPASKGHLRVIPTRKGTSFEDLSEDEFVQLFFGASYAATAGFELLGAQGTNIIASDFGDGAVIDVIPRMENDGLNFLWQPIQGNPAELDAVRKNVKDKVDELIWAKKNPEAAIKVKKTNEALTPKEIKPEEGRVNYLLKSLRRLP